MRLDGTLYSSSPFYDSDAFVRYDVDMDKAGALLSEAGYEPEANGVRFPMRLDIPTVHPARGKLVAQYLKSQFAKLGVEATRYEKLIESRSRSPVETQRRGYRLALIRKRSPTFNSDMRP
ncbi:hypothetical protein G5B40_02685 [Pikeienuella piscinae]|uniref:Solute-binding protein family 5 domain-containing protein n=1 Tax=Pikeienuella piscinae TaxID=2748098 RepID=A0A7L5BVC7_9RHOB|nr:hypothetical protein [Pikeienuella piscinae]QIE54437.1 hypothetical protein G5B40_02685 [Pikeienuella piscinae]